MGTCFKLEKVLKENHEKELFKSAVIRSVMTAKPRGKND